MKKIQILSAIAAVLIIIPSTLLAAPGMDYPTSGTVTKTWNSHSIYDRGLDIAGNLGYWVQASHAGTVDQVHLWTTSYGKHVVMRHPASYNTLYAHNSSIAVGVGQYLTRGQKLAEQGQTGNATGVHSHFEIRRYGNFVYIPGSVGQWINRGALIPYSYPGF